jgi:hypothetical protein
MGYLLTTPEAALVQTVKSPSNTILGLLLFSMNQVEKPRTAAAFGIAVATNCGQIKTGSLSRSDGEGSFPPPHVIGYGSCAASSGSASTPCIAGRNALRRPDIAARCPYQKIQTPEVSDGFRGFAFHRKPFCHAERNLGLSHDRPSALFGFRPFAFGL